MIWLLLFATSTAAVAIAIRCVWLLRYKRFFSHELSKLLESSLYHGDLDAAHQICKKDNSILARIVNTVLFVAHDQDRAERQSTAAEALERQARSVLRQINTLSMCGNIAPMLGLLGTVTGMVDAFMGLGTSMGPEKASILAVSISQALYTTAAGLLIAVPTIALSTICRNILEKRIELLGDDVDKILADIPEQEEES
jgi:biopolymer transport protein ExbB